MREVLFEEMSLTSLIDEAVVFITEHQTPIGYHIGFSGGKDSIVVEHLFKLAQVNYTLHYSCTTIDPPEVVQFIKDQYPECVFHYPKMSFWKGIKKHHPPTVMARWCCTILKKSPGKLSHLFLGIRGEESSSRERYPAVNFKKKSKQTFYYPILHWTEADVWEFISAYDLPYPILYDLGFDRLGCIVCPFRSAQEHKLYRQRYPGIYKVFEKVVSEWWTEKWKMGYAMRHATVEEYLHDWYTNKRKPGLGCSQFAFLNEKELKGFIKI